MGRILKRVPMDFVYPLKMIWEGYLASKSKDKIAAWRDYQGDSICEECERIHANCSQSQPYCLHHPDNYAIWHQDPPTGEGYQLWDTTTEGGPLSPVFEIIEELAGWCEDNATTFGKYTASKEEWLSMLENNFVYHAGNGMVFI